MEEKPQQNKQQENQQLSNQEKAKQKLGITDLDISGLSLKNKPQEILTIQYCAKDQDWIIYDKEPVDTANVKTLTFVTYNIWFSEHRFQERAAELKKIIQESNADFICLQEVTERFYQFLFQDKEFSQQYYISGNKISNYSNLILSKFPTRYIQIQLESGMGRGLIKGHTVINGQNVLVGNCHLESLKSNKEIRRDQLEHIQKNLVSLNAQMDQEQLKQADIFFLGDFNQDVEEETYINPEFVDQWKLLKPQDDKGFTMMASKDSASPWRPDKVLVQSKHWKAAEIQLVGTQPIPYYNDKKPEEAEVTTPSDHFGILTKFTLVD